MIARVAIWCSNCFSIYTNSYWDPAHKFHSILFLCSLFAVRTHSIVSHVWPCDRHKFVRCSSCFFRRTVDYTRHTHTHTAIVSRVPNTPLGIPMMRIASTSNVKKESFSLQSHTLDRTMNGNWMSIFSGRRRSPQSPRANNVCSFTNITNVCKCLFTNSIKKRTHYSRLLTCVSFNISKCSPLRKLRSSSVRAS